MGRVTLLFSEEEFQLFHHFCSNYCRLYDETRKNSIKILLELYNHQVIDIHEHNLDNVFSFFYQKKQEFEIECQVPGIDASGQMRLRVCSDIIAFLEDLEKIYRLIRKKGRNANYYLILGAFSKIADEETRARNEALQTTFAEEINAIVIPLAAAIEKRRGRYADTRTLLGDLVSFTDSFNRFSPPLTFNDETTCLVAISLLRSFNKNEPGEDIPVLLGECRDQFETDELESALEGTHHGDDAWEADISPESLLEPLRTLNERIVQAQVPMQRSLDLLSALESPVKTVPVQAGYSAVSPFRNPSVPARRRDENRILVNVDSRHRSEVRLAPANDYVAVEPSPDYRYKESLPTGIMILVILILAMMVFSFTSAPGIAANNSTPESSAIGARVFGASSMDPAPSTLVLPIVPLPTAGPMEMYVPEPTPEPTPQYVTVEPIPPEPVTGPKSHQEEYAQLARVENYLYDPGEYVTIYANDMEYNLANGYRISFDLKNPPMIIHYIVTPRNITDVKWFEPRDAGKAIDTAVVDRPDEEAWFEMKIYRDGVIYDQEGWGGIYGIPLYQQEVVIRDEGQYQIEFSGRFTSVGSEVLVKREGNIDG